MDSRPGPTSIFQSCYTQKNSFTNLFKLKVGWDTIKGGIWNVREAAVEKLWPYHKTSSLVLHFLKFFVVVGAAATFI